MLINFNIMNRNVEIKNILIPTDFSETANVAVEHGVIMAKLFQAKIYLFHSIEPNIYMLASPMSMLGATDVSDRIYPMKQILDIGAKSMINKYGIDVETVISGGRPALGIAQAVKDKEIDLIMMGTHGANGAQEFFIGSNTHKVVNLSPCPVLTIPLYSKITGFKEIVLPIDNTLHSRQKVNHVIAIALRYGSTVHILGLPNGLDKEDLNKFDIKLNSIIHLLQKNNINYTSEKADGNNLAVETLKYAEKHKSDLIAIMTEHESAMTGMFLGIFAKQIVNHSKIPVLSIRPMEAVAGYESFS